MAGNNANNSKACGARFGCVLCSIVDEDKSLEAQINIAPQTYGYMEGGVRLRKFMRNTLFDFGLSRSNLGKHVDKDGFVALKAHDFSLDYRKSLLRYVLTIDALEQNRAYRERSNRNFNS